MFIGLGYCPLTGYSSGLLLASLLGTLRRHLYIMGLMDSPLCWRCAAEEDTSAVSFECPALVTLRHTYLGSFFFDPEDIRSLGAICYFIRGTGLPKFGHQSKGHKGPGCIGTRRAQTLLLSYSIPTCNTPLSEPYICGFL